MTDTEISYEAPEFYEDIHHLVQPIIGILRLHLSDASSNLPVKYMEQRLTLALGLADLAFGSDQTSRPIDLDLLRDLRAANGCGYFRNEIEEAKPATQARWETHQPKTE